MKWKKRNKKPVFQVQSTDHIIIPAFECGGVQYYQFEDIFKTPYHRALGALVFYEELKMRMSREFIEADTTAHQNINNEMMEILSGKSGRINIIQLGNLVTKSNELLAQKRERLSWVFEPDLLYKLASVMFFDEHESPYSYDMKYCHQKIELWKKHQDVTDFFCHEPIVKLVPYLQASKSDIKNLTKVARSLTAFHMENIYGLLSEDQKGTDSGRNLSSQLEMLRGLEHSDGL